MTEESLILVLSYGDKDYIPLDTFSFNDIDIKNRCLILKYSNKTNDKQLEIFVKDANSFESIIKKAKENTNLFEESNSYVTEDFINLFNSYISDFYKENECYNIPLSDGISLENINANYYENGKLMGSNYSVVPFISDIYKMKQQKVLYKEKETILDEEFKNKYKKYEINELEQPKENSKTIRLTR